MAVGVTLLLEEVTLPTIFAQLMSDDGIWSVDDLSHHWILHTYLTVVKGLVSDLGTVPLNGLDSLEAVPISLRT